ncbi:MAG: response regulator [Tumebacillaceae bacterium]
MKFTTKLYLGFGIILMVVLILLATIMNMLSTMNDRMEQIVANRYSQVRLATTIRYEVNNMDRQLSNLLLSPSGDVQQWQDEIDKSRKNAEIAYAALQKSVGSEQSPELMQKIASYYAAYMKNAQQVFDLYKAGSTQDANERMLITGGQSRAQLLQGVQDLTEAQEKVMAGALSDSRSAYNLAQKFFLTFMVICLPLLFGLTIWVIRSIVKSLDRVAKGITSVSLDSKQLPRLEVHTSDKVGEIAAAFNNMAEAIEGHVQKEEEFVKAIQDHSLLKTKVAEISTMYQGLQDLETLAQNFLNKIVPLVSANYGVFYFREGEGDYAVLHKLAGYAFREGAHTPDRIPIGEGLVGQCAAVKRALLLDHVPADYIKIASGLGESSPAMLWLLPIEQEGEVIGVIELATFGSFNEWHQALMEQVLDTLGVTIGSIATHMQVKLLLGESQALTEELQAQSEEMQLQQEELKSINEMLEEQYKTSELKTKELEEVKIALEEKARQLEFSSNYKSEFLANMSHELRTPLNSLLILAQMLTENAEGNLSAKQVEYASTIYSSGNDLLYLISDILDLSKIESGKMEIVPGEITLSDIQVMIESHFQPIARSKDLPFEVRIESDTSQILFTDEQRLLQILKNLLANAFKFTHRGQITLRVQTAERKGQEMIAFAVEDTGIGIPEEKQEIIFEAFKQADGTTSRKYGGTGLGLSISREIAHLLGGYIELESQEDIGSTFTLLLPLGEMEAQQEAAPSSNRITEPLEPAEHTPSEEEALQPACTELLQDKTVLIVDDDMRNIFALTAALESHRMNVLFAENGAEGLRVLQENPKVDIVLMDIMMPEMDGYQAMRRIREMPEYAKLPIIALTAKAMKPDRERCIEAGASDYISKPVNNEQLFSLLRVWLYR